MARSRRLVHLQRRMARALDRWLATSDPIACLRFFDAARRWEYARRVALGPTMNSKERTTVIAHVVKHYAPLIPHRDRRLVEDVLTKALIDYEFMRGGEGWQPIVRDAYADAVVRDRRDRVWIDLQGRLRRR